MVGKITEMFALGRSRQNSNQNSRASVPGHFQIVPVVVNNQNVLRLQTYRLRKAECYSRIELRAKTAVIAGNVFEIIQDDGVDSSPWSSGEYLKASMTIAISTEVTWCAWGV